MTLRPTIRQQFWKAREWVLAPIWSLEDVGLGGRIAFRRERATVDYQAVFEKSSPLVSICIATYNRAELLTVRSIPSALNQSYRNIEVVVVGDCCTDDTEERVQRISDPRLRFVNLAERGQYPENKLHRWMVGGTKALNHALSLARGDFITHLDDDDEHMSDRVEKLLGLARAERADLVYHPFEYQTPNYEWRVNDAVALKRGQVTTSSMFYHRHFRRIGWDIEAWKRPEPGDWNRLRKIRALGARTVRHPEVLLKHYREESQRTA
jgi:glycosyltransferase involved in cell wall biosynthesis